MKRKKNRRGIENDKLWIASDERKDRLKFRKFRELKIKLAVVSVS